MRTISKYRDKLKDLTYIIKELDNLFDEIYDEAKYQSTHGFQHPSDKEDIAILLKRESDIAHDAAMNANRKLDRFYSLYH